MKQKQAQLNKITTKTATAPTIIIMEYVRCSMASDKYAIASANRIKMHIFLCTIIQLHPFARCHCLCIAFFVGPIHFKHFTLSLCHSLALSLSRSLFAVIRGRIFLRSVCCWFSLFCSCFVGILVGLLLKSWSQAKAVYIALVCLKFHAYDVVICNPLQMLLTYNTERLMLPVLLPLVLLIFQCMLYMSMNLDRATERQTYGKL